MVGIIAVAATPFTETDEIDVPSIRRYVRSCIDKGVVGFAAPAMAGEVYRLSGDEITLVVSTILEEAARAVPVIGGVSADDREERLRNARNVIELGCDGILVHVPYENEEDLADEIRSLAALGPGFIMLQDLDTTETKLPAEVIARLFEEIECLEWIKTETSDRCRKISAIRRATGGRMRTATAGPLMIENLDRGVDAYMPTLYHDIYARVFELHRSGARPEAIELFDRLLPNLVFHTSHPDLAHLVNKRMLVREKVFTTDRVRVEQAVPDDYEARLIDELIENALDLSAKIQGERD